MAESDNSETTKQIVVHNHIHNNFNFNVNAYILGGNRLFGYSVSKIPYMNSILTSSFDSVKYGSVVGYEYLSATVKYAKQIGVPGSDTMYSTYNSVKSGNIPGSQTLNSTYGYVKSGAGAVYSSLPSFGRSS